MTSNIGSHFIQERIPENAKEIDPKILEQTREEVMDLLKKTIRPEFLNRVDEIIMFKPLTFDEVIQIVRLQFEHLAETLAANEIQLKYTEKAVEYIAKAGFDAQFGARPIKRAMQREILNVLSKKILAGDVDKDLIIVADATAEGIVFRNEPNK